jgi:aldehyde dehydrogenase (NAD+)
VVRREALQGVKDVIEHDKLFIGTQWVEPSGTGTLEVISPHTEEVVGRVPEVTTADIDRAVDAARKAFDEGPWPHTDPAERVAVLQKLMELYMARVPDMAQLITTEMGTPISFSMAIQTSPCVMVMQAFLKIAAETEWEERRTGGIFPNGVLVRREPLGVVAAIAPWNIPHFGVISKLAPALIAGCTVVVKPAPETPLSAYPMAEMLAEAGVPEGVVSILPADREVGEHLVLHPGVDKVAFTGSTPAGRRIGAICGEHLKRCSLELGGKSAAIILEDANLPQLIPGLKFATMNISGEACIQQSRILAPRSRYDEVVDAVGAMFEAAVTGDPFDPGTEVGPMVTRTHQERVEKYIALGQEEGARVVTGGSGRPPGVERGWYVQPTVFADVTNDMRIAREEIFGPVIVVIPYDDVDDAVRIANDSEFGLGGSVWGTDTDAAMDVCRRIRAGSVAVNMYGFEFIGPFGGYKSSGIGREFGPEGLGEYLELKQMVQAE